MSKHKKSSMMTNGHLAFIDSLLSDLGESMPNTDEIKNNTYKADGSWSAVEEEQAFIIYKDDPEVLDRLCKFEKLGNYKVGTGVLLNIVDTFYDTVNGNIREGKSSLRVREVDGEPFVTIKGKNQAKDTSSKRSEFEVAWPWDDPSPHDVATLFQMECIQRRQTERIARPLIRKFDDLLVAELVIDRVTYEFGKKTLPVKVHEIEIEMKSSKGLSLYQISSDLLKQFPQLWKWDVSKYGMGKVLELTSQIKTDEDGFLTGSSFWALQNLKTT